MIDFPTFSSIKEIEFTQDFEQDLNKVSNKVFAREEKMISTN